MQAVHVCLLLVLFYYMLIIKFIILWAPLKFEISRIPFVLTKMRGEGKMP